MPKNKKCSHLLQNKSRAKFSICKSSFLTGAKDSHLQRMAIPEAAHRQLRHRPPEYEQGKAQNIQWILINVLYVNR
jgi:hypothetical protein